jgi:Tol biopolymer transport system component
VATYPGALARLLIVLGDPATGLNAVFHFEVASGALALLWHTDAGWVNRAEFSPTGRWLTADLQSDRRMRSTLYLYDLESGELTEYSSLFALPAGYDWSADGRWLLMTDSYMLHLIDPAGGYQIIHPYDANTTCYMAAWVAPG